MMSVAAPPLSPPAVRLRRFTVDEYHRLIEVGVLTERDDVELLEGWIVEKMVRNPRHASTLDRTREAIQKRLPPHWRVRLQSAISTIDSEPEPDLAVVPGPASRYDDRHPNPDEVELLIEVSESSLMTDRGIKARVYATAGIHVYWIVNIPKQTVEVYRLPAEREHVGYPTPQVFSIGDSVPLNVGETSASIPVSELFNG